MIIRYLTQDDVPEHDKITSQAFSYSCEIGNPDSVLPSEKVLGAFDDDNKTLFADFEILEKKCCYGIGTLTCAAVAGVAAKPEHRGKGAVKELFARLISDGGYDISILYPFSEEYYRKLGYESVGRCVSAVVPFSGLREIKRNTDVTLYEGNDSAKLLALYNKCARNLNLCFVRENTEAYSDKPYYSQKYTYIYKDGAYATIEIDRDKSTIFVSEIYFDSFESMLGILGFLRNFESNQSKLSFSKLPENTPLFNVIRDIKSCDIRLHNTGSARILNVKKVLETHNYPVQNGEFTIQAGDEQFAVTVEQGKAEVNISRSLKPDLVMDTAAASQVLLSGTDNALYNPGIIINNPQSDFFGMFPREVSFFTDGF
ncbi:MAG: GNAT family N-acetyltransferase [Clostridia bacterium]|nr:GNAT family N-acetyltransferase [Clostridia bacterium]